LLRCNKGVEATAWRPVAITRARCGPADGGHDRPDTASLPNAGRGWRGIAPDQHITITVEPDDWLAEVRRFARPRVIAKGLTDTDIDRIIEEERDAVQPRLG